MRQREGGNTVNSSSRLPAIPFRRVNCRGSLGYDPGLQRHHILPLQLLSVGAFETMFSAVGRKRVGFDDFRSNGLLLPANENAALRIGMPLHRGAHYHYNMMVIARVGRIEESWSVERANDPALALHSALFRLSLLQDALRRRLLAERRRLVLNKNDPLGTGYDFTELDAMAEQLWNAR